MPNQKSQTKPSPEELKILKDAILKEIGRKPPTIGLVGVSGVGKSSTINTLFKTNLATSDTVACTKEFWSIDLDLAFTEGKAKGVQTNFRVIDAPGLGEDIARDPDYIKMYHDYLPECDVILWILAARNRAIALDQNYLKEFTHLYKRIVFAINQVDLVEPMNWNAKINQPSPEQEKNIEIINDDRRDKLRSIMKGDIKIVPYSARTRYRLQVLFTTILESCPEDRRWIFEGLKNFKFDDFLPEEVRMILEKDKNQSSSTIRKIFG